MSRSGRRVRAPIDGAVADQKIGSSRHLTLTEEALNALELVVREEYAAFGIAVTGENPDTAVILRVTQERVHMPNLTWRKLPCRLKTDKIACPVDPNPFETRAVGSVVRDVRMAA